MAFKRQRIEKIHGFGGAAMDATPQLSRWFYRTEDDTIALVAAAGYFNSMWNRQMAVGDIILVVATDGTQAFKVTAVDKAAKTVTLKKTGTAAGQVATVTASDTIATGLSTVKGVVAVLNDAPAATVTLVTADIGDQAGAPVAGAFLLKTWQPTAAGNTAPIAATTFGKKVNWFAWGD